MLNISVKLLNRPNVDPVDMIGGLARLTQVKDDFDFYSHEKGLKVLDYIQQAGHTSLLESADFGVIITGASRVFLAQITRHRQVSYTSGSQQYQDHDNFPYVIPDSIANDPSSLVDFEWLMKEINEVYIKLKERVGKEDARYVLPGAASNNLWMKANAREWICVIFPQRFCKRNTEETIYIMKLIMEQFIKAGYIDLFMKTGPACVTEGKCDQGRMTCGRPYKSFDDML